MKIIIDRQTLARRARLSHAASLGGLLVLLSSVGISLWQPSWTLLTGLLLFAGGSLAIVGIYFANRWVKKPRPEDLLDQALKGLDDRHRLYHYSLPCDHLLLTPGGIIAIETVPLEGVFTYRDGKWRQRMTPGRAMRFFGEERLGNPIDRAQASAGSIKGRLVEEIPEAASLEARGMVVFTNPFVELNIEKSPLPICKADKVRARLPKDGSKLSMDTYRQIQEKLDEMAGLTP